MKVDVNFKITEGALTEIKKVMEEQDIKDHSLRVSVQGGGCSGFQYGLTFESQEESESSKENDFSENYDGINVLIDKKSALFLSDVTLDWISDLNQRGFKFKNPNATKTCGCGSSFSC